MRFLLSLFFLFSFHTVFTQGLKTPISVRYLSGYIEKNDSLQISGFIKKHRFHPMPHYELVVTDTAAYIHLYQNERQRNENPLGSTFRSHNLYIDFRLQKEFQQSQPWNSGRYQVEASYRPQQFDLLKDSVQVLGYTCYKAVPIDRTDDAQIFFWYTPELPYPLSMFGVSGLPGLVLAFERRHPQFRQVIIAEHIGTETRKLIKPRKGTPISVIEFEKLLIELRDKMFFRY